MEGKETGTQIVDSNPNILIINVNRKVLNIPIKKKKFTCLNFNKNKNTPIIDIRSSL